MSKLGQIWRDRDWYAERIKCHLMGHEDWVGPKGTNLGCQHCWAPRPQWYVNPTPPDTEYNRIISEIYDRITLAFVPLVSVIKDFFDTCVIASRQMGEAFDKMWTDVKEDISAE